MLTTYLLFIYASIIHGSLASLKYEKLLHSKLLNGYNADVRPEPGHGKPVEIHVDVRLKKLIKLDVRNQIFIINAFTMLRWRDPQLVWNTTEYDDVDYITMNNNLIWTPDIVLYNTANEFSFAHTDYYKTKTTIYNDGSVMWTAPVTWQVSCSFDVTWFPVDKQGCNLTFGSWTYSSRQVQLVPWDDHRTEAIVHDHFMVKSGEWQILESSLYYQNLSANCCPEPFSTVVYEYKLSRLSLYYFMYILLPLISLAFLFLMVFFIPADTGERMGFGVTILLSITVYLLVISEELPEKSDDKSMLGVCFIIEFYLLCAALAAALVTTNLSRRTTIPPKFLLRTLDYVQLRSCRDRLRKTRDEQEMEPLEGNGYLHCQNKNQEPTSTTCTTSDECEQAVAWKNVALKLDKYLFYFFLALMALVPLMVASSLDTTSLGQI